MIEFKLPIKTVSEANMSSEHWTNKLKRHNRQKRAIAMFILIHKPKIILPCNITLTRIAPRALDSSDNLPMAFKWIKDYLCDYITPGLQAGRADDNPQIQFNYSQEKGVPKEYAIKITIDTN